MSDLSEEAVRNLSDSIERLTSQMNGMSAGVGRSAGSTSGVPTPKTSSKSVPKSKEFLELESRLASLTKVLEKTGSLSKQDNDEREELIKTLKKEEEAHAKVALSMKEVGKEFKSFGTDLFRGGQSFEGAFKGLSSNLKYSTSVVGKALGGFAGGVSFMLTMMNEFASDARQLGGMADLGAFKIGSITQAKLMSGLGDNFIKVIEQSQGGFKAFGKNSQQSVETLSELARGFRMGSGVISGTLSKNLGPQLTKTMDKAAKSTAAMGLTQEDQANVMGSLSATIQLTAKSEKEAQQMMVKQYAETVDSARTLSNAFGTSSKEILKSIENFRKSTSGQAAALQGVKGAEDIKQALAAAGVSNNEEDLNRMALLIAKGDNGAAATYASPEAMANFQAVTGAVTSAKQANGGVVDAASLAKGMQGQRGNLEAISNSRSNLGAKGTEGLFDAGIAAGVLAKKLDLQAKAAAGDASAKKELEGMFKTSEAKNIQSMDNLADTMRSLRNVLIGLTAGIVGLIGILPAVLAAGGVGAFMSGGAGSVKMIIPALMDFGKSILAGSVAMWKNAGGLVGMAASMGKFVGSLLAGTMAAYRSAGGFTGMLLSMGKFSMALLSSAGAMIKNLAVMAWTILSTVIPALIAMATSAWGSVVGSFGKLGKFIGPVAGWFGKLGPWIAKLVPMLGGMVAGLGSILGGIATAIGGLLAGITAPVWGIIAAVVAVGAGIIYFWDEIVEISGKLWDGFKDLVGWFANGASAIWNAVTGVFSSAFSGLTSILKSGASAIWNSVTGLFSGAFDGLTSILKSGASAIWKVITKPFTSLFGWLSDSWIGKAMGLSKDDPVADNSDPSGNDYYTQSQLGDFSNVPNTPNDGSTRVIGNQPTATQTASTATQTTPTQTTPTISNPNSINGQIAGTITERQYASINTPSVDSNVAGNIVANQDVQTGPKDSPTFTQETVGQLMSMVSSIQNDMAAIRGNTRPSTSDAPVRLS